MSPRTTTRRRGSGEGGVYQRGDGRWVASIEAGRNPDGSRRRRVVYGKTKAEVLAKAADARRELAEGRPHGDPKQTVGTYLDWWLGTLSGRVKPGTATSYSDVVRLYVRPVIGGIPLSDLQPEDVVRMLAVMEEQGLSPRTRQYARAVLSRALRVAERYGRLRRNPAALVDPIPQGQRRPDSLTPEQAGAVLDAAEGTPYGVAVALGLYAGLRRGEVCALLWDDVDLDRQVLTVRATLSRRKGEGLVRADSPKTASSRRTVPLAPTLVAALRAHRVAQATTALATGTASAAAGYVLAGPSGQPVDPRSLLRHFQQLTEGLGLGPRRFHALRHSAATLMLAERVELAVISAILGHASLSITADVYVEVGEALQRDGAEALERVLSRRGVAGM